MVRIKLTVRDPSKSQTSNSSSFDSDQATDASRSTSSRATAQLQAVETATAARETESPQEGTPMDDWDPAYFEQIKALCNSGMSDDEVLQLAYNDIKGPALLQIRLSKNMEDFLSAYNTLHDDKQLHQSTVKKRFTNAFNDVAEQNGIPVEHLKKVYNQISNATKTRKLRGSLGDASKPTGITKTRGSQSSSSSASTKSSRSGRPSRSKKPTKKEVVRKRQEDNDRAQDKFIGATEIEERFTQLANSRPKVVIPKLPTYHPIIRAFNIGLKPEEIALSVNTLIADRATTESVGDLVDGALAEMVAYGQNAPKRQPTAYDSDEEDLSPDFRGKNLKQVKKNFEKSRQTLIGLRGGKRLEAFED